MVIKTDTCQYTEYKVYPGRGTRFVAKDGKVHFFINAKAHHMFKQRIKPVKLTWTTAWRRANKKLKSEELLRKKNRKTVKIQRAIVGISLEDIRKQRASRPAKTAEQTHKDKARKKTEKKDAPAKKVAPQQKAVKNAPKNAPKMAGGLR